MRPILLKAATLGLLALLAGCAQPTPYAPREPGTRTGYTDQQLAPNRWRVTFTGNSATTREQVEDSLLRRAAEVSLAAGSDHFMFDTRDTRANTRVDAFPEPDPVWNGGWMWGRRWNFRPVYGFGYGYGAFGPGVDFVTTTSYQAYAEIVTLSDAQAATEAKALDARAVLQRLPPPKPPA
jgi:hypothetical protein